MVSHNQIFPDGHLFEKIRFLEGANDTLLGYFVHSEMRKVLS